MALAKVIKDKLASKEADRNEDLLFRDERQAKLNKMLIERDIQLKTLRNKRKAQYEAKALERLCLNESRIQAKVQEHIVDQEEKIKAAVLLNVEEKAFLFNQLPEDLRWDWLKNEIKTQSL
ncbi:hypothetical protein DFH28DRAFT_1085735 [Melampsora americana]|nr:hypothetical protein DFH28DRAFT_1085735 [Melampsora americana]